MIWQEILIVLLLILLNGFFALSELAVVSSRRGRLQQYALEGRSGAATALALQSLHLCSVVVTQRRCELSYGGDPHAPYLKESYR